MPKSRRIRQTRTGPDPIAELPNGPALRAGLKTRRVEQHRRGDAQAYRPTEWERLRAAGVLTARHCNAMDVYTAALHWALGTPSTSDSIMALQRGCLDGGGPGDAGGSDQRADEWRRLHRALPLAYRGMLYDAAYGAQVTRVAMFRAALDVLATVVEKNTR